MLLLVTPLSAADENNTQNTIITSGESPASDNETLDVYITPNEFTGIYGNNETPILVYAFDENNESVTEGTVPLIDVFGEDHTIHLENGIGGRYIFCKETGTFNIICQYTRTGKYNNATTTLTLYVPVANYNLHFNYSFFTLTLTIMLFQIIFIRGYIQCSTQMSARLNKIPINDIEARFMKGKKGNFI